MVREQKYPNFFGLKNIDGFLKDVFTDLGIVDECYGNESVINEYKTDYKHKKIGIPAEVFDKKDRYVIELELPRYTKDQIKISLSENILTVKASVLHEDDERKGVEIKKLERSFKLKKLVSPDTIKATLLNGILTLELLFDEKYLAKTIEIV